MPHTYVQAQVKELRDLADQLAQHHEQALNKIEVREQFVSGVGGTFMLQQSQSFSQSDAFLEIVQWGSGSQCFV